MVRVVKAAEMLDLVDTPRRLVDAHAARPALRRRSPRPTSTASGARRSSQLRLFKVTRELMDSGLQVARALGRLTLGAAHESGV